jgi:hypothetical protein
MAENTVETPPEGKIEIGGKSVDVNDFALVVQDKFAEARDYRKDHEQHWLEAYDAYRGKYPSKISKASELAKERGIFVNQTRRKVNSAKIKINTLLFEDGKVPFSITPSRKPRFFPPDIQTPPDRPDMFDDAILERSKQMEFKIRDILDRTNYNEEVQHSTHEMCLYGTGCTKGISLEHKNFPVYTTVSTPDDMVSVESFLEQELMPTCKFVSIWNVFPSPEAINVEDADYVIQRSFLSKIQLKKLAKTVEGFIPGALEEVLQDDIGLAHGWDDSEHPKKYSETSATRLKKFEVLEFWGRLDGEDLEPFIPIDSEDIPDVLPVVITVIGDRVVKIAENPFDDTLPFHFCNWQKNPESIWGDGIYYAIRDAQAILNFSYAMLVEGKSLSAAPLTVIDPNAFEPGTDTEQIYPGKQFRVKPGASVRDSFSSVQIPDVTHGLLSLIQQLEREADLDSGQTSIGYGDMSPSQTKTATGMSILNSNANRQTADVVRSVSSMITKNISAIYRWLMVDSTDISIKGDYEAISTGYEQYVAKEVHNTQLINFLQVIGQMPELKQYLKQEAFARPLLRAFNMEPDKVIKTEAEVTQEMQAQQQAQSQQLEQQAQQQSQAVAQQLQQQTQHKAQLAQQQGQIMQMQTQAQTQSSIAIEQNKALLDEKQSIGEDQRKMETQERLELIKQGNILNPTNLENYSVILREQEMKEQTELAKIQIEEDREAGQEELRQVQEVRQQHEQEQQGQGQEQQGQPQSQPQQAPQQVPQQQPQGQMPEDPTQSGAAQERLEGGPSAQNIRRQEFEENAPQ